MTKWMLLGTVALCAGLMCESAEARGWRQQSCPNCQVYVPTVPVIPAATPPAPPAEDAADAADVEEPSLDVPVATPTYYAPASYTPTYRYARPRLFRWFRR